MKSLSSKTYQCGVTIQGLTTLSGTVYLTGITNTASWDHVIVGTTAQGQIYTRTYAQIMSDITSGIGLSGYVPTSRTLTINGVSYDLTANRSWTITTPYVSKLQHEVKAGVAINKGQAVYVTSANGTNIIVGLASNATEPTSSKTMGLLDATVSTNGFANVITEGLLDGLDTSTAGAAGDPVWLGTGGNLIYGLANKPYAPAHLVFIGIVTRKHANQGEIFVKVQNGFELKEIHDVDLITSAPTAGQLLRYNSDGLWKNWSPNYLTAEADTLATVTGRGATTNTSITVGPDLIVQADGSVNYTASRLWLNSHNNYRGAGVHMSGVGSTWFAGTPYTDFDGGYVIARTGTSNDVSSAQYSNALLTVKSSGNVGIGTSSPSYKLQVNADGAGLYVLGANTAPYTQTIASFVYGGNGNSINIENQGGKASIQARAGASSMDLILNAAGSNVGIGTASPAYKLQVTGGDIAIDYNRYLRGGGGGDWNLVNLYNGGTGDIEITMLNANWYLRHNANASFAGKVGIGNTTPYSKLEITPSSVAWGEGIVINPASGYSAVFYRLEGAQGSNYTGTWAVGKAYSGDGGGELLQVVKNGLTGSAAYRVDASQQWKTNGDSIFGFNVGIGTTNPSNKLDVTVDLAGAQRVAVFKNTYSTGYTSIAIDRPNTARYSFLEHSTAGTTDWYVGTAYNGGGGNSAYQIGTGINTSDSKLFITTGGNVGIGTSSPAFPLTVYHATNSAATFQTSGTGTGAGNGFYVGHTSNISYVWNYNNFPLVLATNNTERVRVTEGGNVGIGTTAPAIPRGSGFRPMLHVYNNSAGTNPAIVVSAEDNQMAGYIAGDNAGSSDIGWGWNAYYQGSGNNFYNIRIGDNGTWTDRFTIDRYGLVGIGTTTPSTLLDVNGVITATGGNSTNWNTAYGWGNHSSANYVPQARTLTINGTSYDLSANRSWTIATTTPGGSDTQVQYNSSGSLAGASALTYNSTTNRVGINQAFPGYDLDVNGQVRVQDKLRVGTGNGVVHMSSTATINASATTVVWAQTVSVGMCAFIEYYILNNNSLTDQRAGTIMVTWNQSGTPTIAHTETTTPDIGSTTTVNFTSSLVGSDARINAVNSSANPYTMVMSYKYF